MFKIFSSNPVYDPITKVGPATEIENYHLLYVRLSLRYSCASA